MKDYLPEIPEAQASGELKGIYEDMKSVLGVPMVNLIFRHIATFPGCLEWVWRTLRPPYGAGELPRLGKELFSNLMVPAPPLLSPFALRAIGVSPTDEKILSRILDAYNRANCMNLIALHTLLNLMGKDFLNVSSGASPHPASLPLAPTEGPAPGRTSEEIPAMLSLEEMDEATQGLVHELMGLRPKEKIPVIASLYRHLARWPGYLALVVTILRPMAVSGTLEGLVDRTRSLAEAKAGGLAVRLSATAAPLSADEDRKAALEKSLRFFARDLIVEMIPIGKLLLQTLPASPG